MKKTYSLVLVGVMALVPVTRAVDRIVTNNAATGPGSLTAAINALNNGDRIVFHIPPEAGEVHYIQTPQDGYPLITKNDITVDGYTQGGASPNTASIHAANNAVLKIVLTSTNYNALSMYTACSTFAGIAYPNFGFGDGEQAILGFFRASNAWVKGICFQAAPLTTTSQQADGYCKSICFAVDAPDVSSQACQNFHVSGCWFGLNPVTGQVAYMPDGTTVASPAICIATYGTGTNGTIPGFPNIENYSSGTVGVAARSPTPRAEFNVFVTGYGFDSQGGPFQVSGNFWGVLPDGVTAADMSVLNGGAQQGDGFTEYGDPHDIVIGTDGDGVNDDQEGNIFGPIAGGGAVCIDFYHGPQSNIVVAGNYFNADIHGNSFGANLGTILDKAENVGTVRFGSDFNGVSDALEGNLAFNEFLFKFDTTWPTDRAWISVRGNSMVNCFSATASGRPSIGDGQAAADGLNVYANFIDISGSTMDIIPVIGAGTTTTSLTGTCGKRLHKYIRVVVDLYEADTTSGAPPQGKKWLGRFMENSAADSNPAEGAFTFNTTALGIAHGTAVTIAATYIIDLTITSVSRSGGNTTLTISGGTPPYDILGATSVTGPYSLVATAPGTTVTFAAPASMSSYQVVYHPQISSGSGQTSPFSDVFTIP
jgi:hypothetical protein